jgi:hypothetical protein
MPSALHEAIVELFRQRPVLAAELLRETLAVPLPAFTAARIESAAFTDLAPAEYRADLVVLLAAEEPVLGIVVEVQLRIDGKKRYSWPLYAASLRVRLGCPTCVLIYAPDAEVAAWAAATVPGGPGWSLQPLVLGPQLMPIVAEPDQAAARPELAVLSVMAHGRRLPPHEAALMATTAVNAAAAHRDDDLAKLYYDLVISALSDAARKAFEAMHLKNYEYQSEFARKYVAEGRQEGMAKGMAEAILQVLAARGVEVPEAVRQRVLSCTDPAVLDGWVRRAALAATAAEVVEGHP